MIQRILHSRGFVAALLAMGTGIFLYYTHPFPENQIFLRVISIRTPYALLSFEYLYNTFLFTTPFMVFSTVLSGLYIFTLKVRRRISPGRLPRYPDPRKRDNLYLVVGEVHNPRKPGPSATPRWLTIPERGLFTGIAIFGAVGPKSGVKFAVFMQNGPQIDICSGNLCSSRSKSSQVKFRLPSVLVCELDVEFPPPSWQGRES